MLRNYFRTAWRNLIKNRFSSLINVGGLAIGMTVTMLIGLWMYDELSFNKYHQNYERIAQVWSGGVNLETQQIEGDYAMQYPVGTTLKNNYPQFFKHVLMAWGPGDYTLAAENKKFNKKGQFIEAGAIDMFSLKMLNGSLRSLDKPHSILLSKSTAEAIFGKEDPINKSLRIDSRMDVQVTGVYEDIPRNNRFSEIQFISPWSLWFLSNEWVREKENDWDNRPFSIYVELQPNVRLETANAKIRDLYSKNVPRDYFQTIEATKPFVQLVPMSSWHLYSEFREGKPATGRIRFVWLFGTIGVFVLLLACINFVNLSTARSEKRAKEVGVRKTMGSGKWQLIGQFLSESLLIVIIAFIVSIGFLELSQNWFNELADKNIRVPFSSPVFWILTLAFIGVTGFLAGLYPAFYLSSFKPVKVLKGVLRSGRYAALPRKVLVVVQFTVSVILIIGTMIVYEQVEFSRSRPIGYDRQSLITVPLNNPDYNGKEEVLRSELMRTGVVASAATASSPLTAVWNVTSGYEWAGKDPSMETEFANCKVSPDFGKTVGWEVMAGRDFSRDLATDSTESIVINESAVKYMGLKDPVGKKLVDVDEFGTPKWSRTIIGVVKDMVMESPYEPVKQTIYYIDKDASHLMHVRINATASASDALPKIAAAFEKVVPSALFDYKFVDDVYATKFSQEERIGKLSALFSVLAIFISCLGLFGLASFVAEQRTKEIGIRKVLGSSITQVWQLLSKDFLLLVLISCVVAIPLAYYYMQSWLQQYDYRTTISWEVFVLATMGALLITVVTVSYQAIKVALANPVKSLRSE